MRRSCSKDSSHFATNPTRTLAMCCSALMACVIYHLRPPITVGLIWMALPPSSPASSSDKALALPYEATRARTAFIATHLLEQAEGSISCPQEDTRARLTPTMVVSREQSEGHTPTPYEDTRASQARKIIASHQLPTSEGHNLRVRDLTSLSVSWSLPLVSMSISPSIFFLPARNPNPHTQHKLRHDPQS